jgi:hypothetical protein
MTNKEAVERFDGYTSSSYINKLFWIAGSFENMDFKDFLAEMDKNNWKSCLPEIGNSKYFKDYQENNEMGQALIDHDKFGLIAEILHPKHYTNAHAHRTSRYFTFAITEIRISYVYAETLEELMLAIEKSSEKIYREYVSKDKKTPTPNP